MSCPVEELERVTPHPAASPGHSAAGRLWLLVDAAEIASTVRRGVVGAVGLVAAAIFFAMVCQLAIALFVIHRLDESMRRLRETQDRLVRSDKLAAVGTLSAGIAHEINNPLCYVVTNLEYLDDTLEERGLLRDQPDADELRMLLSEARQGAERVRVIVRDVKALARGDEEKVEPLDIRAVVKSSISLATNEIKHRAQLVYDFGDVVPVDGNEVRLGQVFLNLLVNAAHAIPAGELEGHEIRVATRMAEDGRVAVEVRDTGVGIPPKNMARLFDPFFTTKAIGEGTGLGLWVCHGIVSSLGGEIAVESEVGRGTVVRVLLRASQGTVSSSGEAGAAAPAAGASAPSKAPAGLRARVLVVDDEPPVRRAVERLLRSRYEVVSSPNARDALARIGGGERFDAVVSDVMMPMMTGIEFFGELARISPELAQRVVFMTGGAFTSEAVEFLGRTPNPRVYKPIRGLQLHAALEEVLRPPALALGDPAGQGVPARHGVASA